MSFPTYTMRELLEAGVHFGHTTRRWNPKMAPYLFGVRNGIHIIDLEQTVPLLHQGLKAIRDIVAGGGRVLFVGTKRQASERLSEAAKRCGQYYVNHRWLGGMLTNWKTISGSIKRLKEVEVRLVEEQAGLTKKELLNLTRERDKLERALGGIRDMGGLPDVIFIVDTVKEHIAVDEARNLNIPVVGILDSNADPANITFPIPGNDDATRSIDLYCNLVADAVLDGIQKELIATGTDIGADAEAKGEAVPEKAEAEEVAEESPAKDSPAKDSPAKDSPAAEGPAKDSPAKDSPAAESPAKEGTAEESPADESKKSEAVEEKPETESKAEESEAKDKAKAKDPEVPAEVAAEAVEAAQPDDKQAKA